MFLVPKSIGIQAMVLAQWVADSQNATSKLGENS
jgi:hypothetical protein